MSNTNTIKRVHKQKVPKQKRLAVSVNNLVGFDRLPADLSTNSWLTPKEIVEATGPYDLDPCADIDMPWPTAKRMLTKKENGLTTPWAEWDFVFMNPPYSREKAEGTDIGDWMDKLAGHPGGGIALVFFRSDTKWFHRSVFNHPKATSMVVCEGRLKFCRRDGSQDKPAPVGSVFVAYGKKADARLVAALNKGAIKGAYLKIAGRLKNFGASDAANDEVGVAA